MRWRNVKDISFTLIQSPPRTYSFNPQAEPDLSPDLSRCLSRDLEICPLICVRAGKKSTWAQKMVSWATELHGWKWKNDIDTFMLRSWLSRESTLPKTNSSHLKIGFPKMKVVSQPPFFRGYVSFREGNMCELFIMLDICFLEQSRQRARVGTLPQSHIESTAGSDISVLDKSGPPNRRGRPCHLCFCRLANSGTHLKLHGYIFCHTNDELLATTQPTTATSSLEGAIIKYH